MPQNKWRNKLNAQLWDGDTTDIWGNKEGLVEEGGGSVTKKKKKKTPYKST